MEDHRYADNCPNENREGPLRWAEPIRISFRFDEEDAARAKDADVRLLHLEPGLSHQGKGPPKLSIGFFP